jgi:hypothetical protein
MQSPCKKGRQGSARESVECGCLGSSSDSNNYFLSKNRDWLGR